MAFCDFCRREKDGPIAVAAYRVRVYRGRSWFRRLLGIRPHMETLNACAMHRMDAAGGDTQDLTSTINGIPEKLWRNWN